MNFQEVGREIPNLYPPGSSRVFQGLPGPLLASPLQGGKNGSDAPLLVR